MAMLLNRKKANSLIVKEYNKDVIIDVVIVYDYRSSQCSFINARIVGKS
jgi:hypothetical protein